jgi:hypothetical protein
MNLGGLRVLSAIAIALLLGSTALPAQDEYDPRTLEVKLRFGRGALQAVNEPFLGVTRNGRVESGLFEIRATGVSTAPVVKAAGAFLDSLDAEQRIQSIYSVEDPEWRHWSNVDNGIFVRRGVSLKAMSQSQRDAAMGLMRASLSARGFDLSRGIMKTDQTLREINGGDFTLDEELYYFTLMGLPSASEPWGWQLDGHHLVINYFVLGDQVVMTPVFMGAEPAVTTSGKYAGNRVLQDEQDLGLALMNALDRKQQAAATLNGIKTGSNNRGEANRDNLVLDYEGVPVSGFSENQKDLMLELIGLFVGNMREGHAEVRMEEVAAHLDETWFAWVGETSDDAVFYYRIHSPVVLVEFDHQLPVGTRRINPRREPSRDHIHTVVRTPNGNDYGKDLLRQHLEQHKH